MRYSLKQLEREAAAIARQNKAHLPGMDFEDLKQEALMIMWLAIATNGVRASNTGADLNVIGRNHLRQIVRRQRAEKRCPQDVYGRPLLFIDVDEVAASYRIERDMPIEPPAASIPPCHVRGEDPEGYDSEDPLCHNCSDKFSCLVETEATGLTSALVRDDPEVQLVLDSKNDATALAIAHEVVMERMRRRVRLRTLKEPVPAELAVTSPIGLPPLPEPLPARQRRAGASLGAPVPSEPLPTPEKLPSPKTLTPAELDQAVSRIRVGQPFPLEIGHVLVRRRRGGPDVCVEIREDGFWLNLNQVTYGSLSTAAKAAEVIFGASYQTNRPGNAYFNIVRRFNTEIRDAATGAVLACRRGTR